MNWSNTIVVHCLLLLFHKTLGKLELPRGFSKESYCYGCLCVINEIENDLGELKHDDQELESKVYETMDTVCGGKHYTQYEFIPPKMVKICQYITEKDPEAMEDLLLEHYKTKDRELKDLEKALCINLIETCEENSPSRSEFEAKSRESRGSTKARVVNMDGSEDEFDVPLSNSQEDIDKAKKEREARKKKKETEETEKKEEL